MSFNVGVTLVIWISIATMICLVVKRRLMSTFARLPSISLPDVESYRFVGRVRI